MDSYLSLITFMDYIRSTCVVCLNITISFKTNDVYDIASDFLTRMETCATTKRIYVFKIFIGAGNFFHHHGVQTGSGAH